MRYLLDTCLLSELVKPEPSPSVIDWLTGADESTLFLSVLTLGEIQKGISGMAEGGRKRKLQQWLDNDLQQRFAGRILPVDAQTAADWGLLSGQARALGRAVPVIDGLLAATARQHDLSLVTRNTSDFADLGVVVVNPWQA